MSSSINRFWSLAPTESVRRYATWAYGEVEVQSVICPVNPGHRRSGPRVGELSVLLPPGPIEDFVWTWIGECLVSQRALSVLRMNQISGFRVRDARARYGGLDASAPDLKELVIVGWGGMARPESGIRAVESCTWCGLRKFSCFDHPESLVDPSGWDRSDMFIVWPLPRFIFISEHLAAIIRQEELTGARLVHVEELRCSSGSISPGRLASWLPEDVLKAKQLDPERY